MKTDLQKFKDLFNEIGVKYVEDKRQEYSICKYKENGYQYGDEYMTDVIILYIHNSHLQYNYGAELEIIFDADNEKLICFETWGE